MSIVAAPFIYALRLYQALASRLWRPMAGVVLAGVLVGLIACAGGSSAKSRTPAPTLDPAATATDSTEETLLAAAVAAGTAITVTPPPARASSAPSGLPAPSSQAPQHAPSPRFSPGMVYDGARDEVILFGGATVESGFMNYFSDTWTWNGSLWKQVHPAHSPSPRAWPEMTYDEARRQVVLFGGQAPDVPRLTDTWIWDGSDWTQARPAFTPIGTIEEGIAFFPVTGTVLMYSASAMGGQKSHLYSWDGSNWTDLAFSGGPSYSSLQGGLSLDTTRGTMVLLAYDMNAIHDPNPRLRHWEFDGEAWTQRDVTRPPLRSLVQTVTDTKRGEIVMFGGVGHNDTWTGKGGEWKQQNPAHSPDVRSSTGPAPGMAYDATRNRVVVFGGWADAVGPLGDTWTWDGRDWTPRA
jgi:hypothetical protein